MAMGFEGQVLKMSCSRLSNRRGKVGWGVQGVGAGKKSNKGLVRIHMNITRSLGR